MNVKWFVQLSKGMFSANAKPKTVLIIPYSNTQEERILSNVKIIGNYSISFQKLPCTPIWWSTSMIDPKAISTSLDRQLKHSNFLVLRIE